MAGCKCINEIFLCGSNDQRRFIKAIVPSRVVLNPLEESINNHTNIDAPQGIGKFEDGASGLVGWQTLSCSRICAHPANPEDHENYVLYNCSRQKIDVGPGGGGGGGGLTCLIVGHHHKNVHIQVIVDCVSDGQAAVRASKA